MSSIEPPESNPILTAYESFERDTPLVTRYILKTLVITFILSIFVNPSDAASNIPLFTIFHFEFYRVATSPLLCSNLTSLLFSYFGLTDHGKRFEHGLGSTAFAALLITLAGITNIIYLLVVLLLNISSGDGVWLIDKAEGIWLVLFPLIAVDCSNAPPDGTKRLFFIEVPAKYYPIALVLLFALFAGPNLAYAISVGVGYAYGYGKFDALKVSTERCRYWEDRYLDSLSSRPGWVVGHAASGSTAWLPTTSQDSSSSAWTPSSFLQGRATSASSSLGDDSGATFSSPGAVRPIQDMSSFPPTGGRKLGRAVTKKTDLIKARLSKLDQKNQSDMA